jgi:amidase
MRTLPWYLLLVLIAAPSFAASPDSMNRDLLEVTVPQLEQMYREHKYTVTQVVQWYRARIAKYNGIYRAVQNVDTAGALAAAAREDAEASPHGALWGVPIVTKANTSVKGLVTTDGWQGYMIPGHELVAPKDAVIVAKLRAAGAIIIGQTNMPDFAASDTNRSTAYGRTGNAYDVRFSPGGSSGGTVTAVTANFAVLGNGTDTGNSIRMPAATSSVVGVFPTRGLVSIAGIAPLDWLLDNTGPIARDVTDATIALDVMAGEDPLAELGPYTAYLKTDALKGKRFGVPAFILQGTGIPFHGMPPTEPSSMAAADRAAAQTLLRPETRAAFMKALEGLRAAGATVVFDDSLLDDSFAEEASHICTLPYIREGTENFLAEYGPPQYRSIEEYEKTVGSRLPHQIINSTDDDNVRPTMKQTSQLPGSQAQDARSLHRHAGPPASGWVRLSGSTDAATRRNHAPGWKDQRRPSQRYRLGEHDRRAGCGCAWRLLSRRPSLWSGDFRPAVERRRPARLGICLRAGHQAPQTTRAGRTGSAAQCAMT